MKVKLLLLLLCLSSLCVMGDDNKGTQGTITRDSTRKKKKEEPKKKEESKKQGGQGKSSTNRQASNNNQSANKPVSKPSRPSNGYVSGHKWVDLGLSVKWATMNVGANSPSDYGGYYAWGETRTKSSYDWSNCYDCVNPNDWDKDSGWGTYKLGGQTRITPSSGHDTARENWGGSWRMPTDSENDELCKKCKWTWTSKNGHNGYNVTGPNGNSIFLPAAGWRGGTSSDCVGGLGGYWSSTLSSSYSYGARYLFFGSSNHYTDYGNRRYGRSVRPVTE